MYIIEMTEKEYELLYKAIVKQIYAQSSEVNSDRRLLELLERGYSVSNELWKRWRELDF